MIQDFELEQRYLKTVQDTKNKWQKENKQYLERVEQMKEKKGNDYKNKRNNLIQNYNRKQKEIEKQLYKIRESKEGERKKHIKIMKEKEEFALKQKKLKAEKEEKERVRYETQIYSKSN